MQESRVMLTVSVELNRDIIPVSVCIEIARLDRTSDTEIDRQIKRRNSLTGQKPVCIVFEWSFTTTKSKSEPLP